MAERDEDIRDIKEEEIRGPVGLLIKSMQEMGAEISEDLQIKVQDEPDLDLMEVPFQALEPELVERARNARSKKAAEKVGGGRKLKR